MKSVSISFIGLLLFSANSFAQPRTLQHSKAAAETKLCLSTSSAQIAAMNPRELKLLAQVCENAESSFHNSNHVRDLLYAKAETALYYASVIEAYGGDQVKDGGSNSQSGVSASEAMQCQQANIPLSICGSVFQPGH